MRLKDWQDKQLRTDAEYAEAARALGAAHDLADHVVELRIKAGLTQADLARAAGITQPMLSKLESGVGNPNLKTLQRVGRALGVTLEFAPIAVTAAVPHAEAVPLIAFDLNRLPSVAAGQTGSRPAAKFEVVEYIAVGANADFANAA